MKIEQALIDPRWSWGFIELGAQRLPCLTLHSPAHGDIHSILSPDVMQQLGEWLVSGGSVRVGENPGKAEIH